MATEPPVSAQDTKTWEQALENIIDWLIRSTPRVGEYVAKLREQYPGDSDDDLARRIAKRKALKSGFIGFVTGLPGLPALPVTLPTDLAGTWRVQISLIVSVAHVYGHTSDTTDLKTDIYLVLAGNSAKEAMKRFGIEASKEVTKKAVGKYVTRDVMKQIWKVLGSKIITKAGEKSLTSFIKMVPVVGGVVGFAFDWAATRAVGAFAVKYYGGSRALGDATDWVPVVVADASSQQVRSKLTVDTAPCPALPAAAPEPAPSRPGTMTALDTWAGKSEFGYTGSVSDGVAILYGSGMARKATVPAKALNALLAEFRGRTVAIGASRNAPEGSVGAWLQDNVRKTATASYIGPILLAERYAERVGKSDIRFLPRRRPAK